MATPIVIRDSNFPSSVFLDSTRKRTNYELQNESGLSELISVISDMFEGASDCAIYSERHSLYGRDIMVLPRNCL